MFAKIVKSLYIDQSAEDEFETYLAIKITYPLELELQLVLDWWKNNSAIFQELAKMAHDIFLVLCIMAGVEHEFSKRQ